MQYPLPQFTDVEDRIIGPFTIKQFGIVFSVGMLIVLIYSATKSLAVAVVLILLLGVPALYVAFGKFNGRPVYNTFPVIINFLFSPKFLVFHKEAVNFSSDTKLKNVDLKKTEEMPVLMQKKEDPKAKLRELNKLLESQAAREKELVRQIR